MSKIREDIEELVGDSVSGEVIDSLATLVERSVIAERRRCVDVCHRRAETWRSTSSASGPAPYAREEARARANEATYLAELIEAGRDLDAATDTAM